MRLLRGLLAAGVVLAFSVVVLGAYVRLKDAGLGCPDWPGCYGQLVGVPLSAAGEPIDQHKAWIEVSHRYLAAVLGLAIVAIAVVAWRSAADATLRLWSALLVLLLLFQAGLGALTVTELLAPVIVTGHLVGGMSILAILVALALYARRAAAAPAPPHSRRVLRLGLLALVLLGVQVVLGGWVSTNYAGLACGTSFPSCSGSWEFPADASGFALDRELAKDSAGRPLTQRALAAIQYSHRIGALVLVLAMAALIFLLWRERRRALAASALVLLFIQLFLGIYIVYRALPLMPSLLHNLGAAALVAWFMAFFVLGGGGSRQGAAARS